MNCRIALLTGFIFIFSCTKELKENEKKWNPYTLNEVIIFESSEKQLDTIVINEINDEAVSDGPTPRLYNHTSLLVYAKKLKLENSFFSKNRILEISSSTPNKASTIIFELYFEKSQFGSWHKLDELSKLPIISVTTKAGVFNDVIKIKPVTYYPEREDEVKFMYWSKKDGYIKFERADGFTWELIKKYIPNNL